MKLKNILLTIIFILSTNVMMCANEKIIDIKPFITNYRQPMITPSIQNLLDSVCAEKMTPFGCSYYVKFQFDSLGKSNSISVRPIFRKHDFNKSELFFQAVDTVKNILKEEVKLWEVNIDSLFPDGMSYIDKNWKPYVVIFYDFYYESKYYVNYGTIPQSIFKSFINEEIYVEPKPNE